MSKKKLEWADPVLVNLRSTANGADLLCEGGSAAVECGGGSAASQLCDAGVDGTPPPDPK